MQRSGRECRDPKAEGVGMAQGKQEEVEVRDIFLRCMWLGYGL